MYKHNTARHANTKYSMSGTLTRLLFIILLFSGSDAFAQEPVSNDFDMPISVKSDEQFVDAKLKTSVFEKNVVINQGSLAIIAEYVKVDAANGKGREVFTIKGTPASYTQTLADGSSVNAKASTITYDIGTRTISLEGNAELVQNASTVKGDSIVFDMEKEQMRAQGNSGKDEQVETIFTPDSIPSANDDQSNTGNP